MSCKVYGFYIVLSFKKQILHIVPLFVSGIYMKTFRGQKKDSGTQLSQEIAGFNPLKIFLKIFPKFPQTIDVKHRSHCLASESVWRHVPAKCASFPAIFCCRQNLLDYPLIIIKSVQGCSCHLVSSFFWLTCNCSIQSPFDNQEYFRSTMNAAEIQKSVWP